jgi:hypothetical protein
VDYDVCVPREVRKFNDNREYARHNEKDIYDDWSSHSSAIARAAAGELSSEEEEQKTVKQWRFVLALPYFFVLWLTVRSKLLENVVSTRASSALPEKQKGRSLSQAFSVIETSAETNATSNLKYVFFFGLDDHFRLIS